MSLKSRVQRLEEKVGIVGPDEPPQRRIIFIIFKDPGVVDADGNRIGAGECESHVATAGDLRFERADDETLDAFRERIRNSLPVSPRKVHIVFMEPDRDVEPVPRENPAKVDP